MPYNRLVSRGFTPGRSAPVDAGRFDLTLTLGTREEKLTVDVATGASARDVLNSVAEAVNAAGLPVEARVLTQTSPGQRVAGSTGRGDLLVLSVNEGLGNGELSVRDAKGHLAKALDHCRDVTGHRPGRSLPIPSRQAAPASPRPTSVATSTPAPPPTWRPGPIP
jgi:hypothetical protein